MKPVFASLLFLALSATASAQDEAATRTKHYNLDKTLAIEGYDPVAYFSQSRAVKGKRELSDHYRGVDYYFSSAANRDEFKKSPAAYEPQYGGWCAYAMGAKGEKVSIDPETFKIVNGKLYLFYNRFFNNTLKSWNREETNLKTKADHYWATILSH